MANMMDTDQMQFLPWIPDDAAVLDDDMNTDTLQIMIMGGKSRRGLWFHLAPVRQYPQLPAYLY